MKIPKERCLSVLSRRHLVSREWNEQQHKGQQSVASRGKDVESGMWKQICSKRWAGSCLHMAKCSQKAAWVLAGGEALRTSGWRRHAPLARLLAESSQNGGDWSLALGDGAWGRLGWGGPPPAPGTNLGSKAALKVLSHVGHGNFVLRPLRSAAARYYRFQI